MMFKSINPMTGAVIAEYAQTTPAEVQNILEQAQQAQQAWRKVCFEERAGLMLNVADLLVTNKQQYAEMMTNEMGKITAQGIAEIEKCAWVCRFYAEQAAQFLGSEDIETDAHHSFVSYHPLGIVLAVMPWNFPFWQVFRFAAPGLMAGNGCILKHARNVSGCALMIESVFREANFPEHLFCSLLIGIPETTRVLQDPRIAAVTITSSVNAGRTVATEAGKVLKKCVLELGGADAFIVLEDADIDKAVEVGIIGRFQNSGQSCIAAKRFIVVKAVYEEFKQKFVTAVSRLKMGDPSEEGIYIGPQARMDLRDVLAEQVQRSVIAGASVLIGGEVPEGEGAFYPPTVLANVKPGMAAWSEELFGPVATLICVADEAEAIQVANGTDFGLSGSIWTQDLARGERIATNQIESGAAFVNDMSRSDPRMPFGGIRQSGYGRELGIFGIREFVNIHSVWVNKL
ncbi:MAG: NAD-dependent succinate-semialdehyde dehydrogenase [Gammaproteobacteria bacterium]|nr:NAD-dependent succinate-semialdehyde dehydrogenase [Gammaproteobacteria bacterium]